MQVPDCPFLINLSTCLAFFFTISSNELHELSLPEKGQWLCAAITFDNLAHGQPSWPFLENHYYNEVQRARLRPQVSRLLPRLGRPRVKTASHQLVVGRLFSLFDWRRRRIVLAPYKKKARALVSGLLLYYFYFIVMSEKMCLSIQCYYYSLILLHTLSNDLKWSPAASMIVIYVVLKTGTKLYRQFRRQTEFVIG